MRLSFLLFCSFFILFLSGCGYKPSSHYAKKELQGNIFVDLAINLKDPRNTVLIKDAMNELIVSKLDSKLVFDKDKADTIVNLKLNSVSMQELQYDEKGYNKLYKSVVSILVSYKNRVGESNSFNVVGDYDFSIDNNTTITDSKRFEAIKEASNEALEEVISKLAINSFKKKN